MGNVMRRALLTAAACLMAGCSGSVEDRINAAIPLSREVESAKAAFDAAAKTMQADTSVLEADYAAQLKIRALECSRGNQPSMFASKESIQREIGNKECFRVADTKLLQWLGMRRIGWLAAMPPLRPVPAKPANILTAPGRITQTAFADKAGVAILQGREAYVVVDLAGTEIRKGDLGSSKLLSLSPNGRLLAVADETEAQVLDTETGELLATLIELRASRVVFVGDKGLAYAKREGGLAYRDFGTGAETIVPVNTSFLWSVLRPSDVAQNYLVIGGDRIGGIELKPDGQGMKPTLTHEEKLAGNIGWGDTPTVAHGALVYGGGEKLNRLDLAAMSTESVDFAPIRPSRIMPTRDPDVVLLSYNDRGGSNLQAYSFRARTLAKVDMSTMLSSRLLYIPVVNSNALIDGEKLVMVDKLTMGAPESLADAGHRIKFETQIAELEMMDRMQQLRGSQANQTGLSMPSSFRTGDPRLGAGPASVSMGAAQRFSAGQAGLVEAMRAGLLRLGGSGDVDSWKMAYMTKNRRMPSKGFDEQMAHRSVYVVTGNMTLPSGLNGAHAVVFVVERGAPFPQGDGGHSPVLDMGSGQCQGSICSMYLQ